MAAWPKYCTSTPISHGQRDADPAPNRADAKLSVPGRPETSPNRQRLGRCPGIDYAGAEKQTRRCVEECEPAVGRLHTNPREINE